jgi:hypothetical protein
MADWFIEHLPEDGLPFWDFDAEIAPDVTPRDSSAATIAASGMILLQEQIDNCEGKGKWQRHGRQRHRKQQITSEPRISYSKQA